MKKLLCKFEYTAAVVLAVLLITSCFVGGGALQARAAVSASTSTEMQAAYEAQNVWEDLQEATIDGEKLDLTLYNFDEHKNVQVISFVEFCYSFYSNKQADYGLYVYVYNPRGLDWTQKPAMNKIQFRYGGASNSSYAKYALKYINRSNKDGYEGLFYKFKIDLTETERAAILKGVNSTERIYELSGIELYSDGRNATEYKIANTFRYTGYAKGYGSINAENNTLKCTSDGLVTLSLDVHPTFYRPKGINDKNKYTQDSLHSVYFSIPNKILQEYGGLSEVHATWLNAITNWGVVTGNYDAYANVEKFINYEIPCSEFGQPEEVEGLNYAFVSEYDSHYDPFQSSAPQYRGKTGYNFYWFADWEKCTFINRLDYLFYSGSDIDSADNYTVKSKELLNWFDSYTKKYHTEEALVLDKYSPHLFEKVDEDFTDAHISAGDKRTLKNFKISQTEWWEKLFGIERVETDYYNGIEGIREITKEDFESDNADLICQKLYIDRSDYDDFKNFFNIATLSNETVFLLRYQVSDYISEEASTIKCYGRNVQDTNSYFFKETVNLDFDIIDITCCKDGVNTVIACVMSPIDIVHDATKPVYTKSDRTPWWAWVIIALVAFVVILVVLCVIFPRIITPVLSALKTILKGILWLICLPFRGLAALFRTISKRRKQRRESREIVRQEKLDRKGQAAIDRYQDKLDNNELKRQEKQKRKKERKEQKRKAKQKAKAERNRRKKAAQKKRKTAKTGKTVKSDEAVKPGKTGKTSGKITKKADKAK